MDENQKRYLEQIDRYYKNELKSNEFVLVGNTPSFLVVLGAKNNDVIINQNTLNKCTRLHKGSISAHELSRKMIEEIPFQLNHPVFVVDERERNSFALISDSVDKDGLPMLMAISLDSNSHGNVVNEIKSFYGRNNLEFYLTQKHTEDEVYILDKEKAKVLSRFLRLQLPTAWKVLDYSDICNERLQPFDENVNSKICKDLKSNGFQPTQSLVSKFQELNRLSGSENSIRDVHTIYSGLKNPDIQKLVTEIAEECRQQEITFKYEREDIGCKQ